MKPKREITLGEMQDECNKHDDCEMCKFMLLCPNYMDKSFSCIDLTDPPRFTEAQMAFWKAWYDVGARSVVFSDRDLMYVIQEKPRDLTKAFGKITLLLGQEMGLSQEKLLDLAELFGKE